MNEELHHSGLCCRVGHLEGGNETQIWGESPAFPIMALDQ